MKVIHEESVHTIRVEYGSGYVDITLTGWEPGVKHVAEAVRAALDLIPYPKEKSE